MGGLRIKLFGKFDVALGEQSLTGLEATKTQELMAYLLLHRDRPHNREKLATLLWPNSSLSQSKGYLRQTLWQIQSALEDENPLSQEETDWVHICHPDSMWLDVAHFEQAWSRGEGIQGTDLTQAQAEALQAGVALYQGELLENWYQDWCLFERERLQNIYLAMLEKLMGYCEVNVRYDAGTGYAIRILRCDPAHERTYRRLMRLYYLAGDRTAALRTYERCTAALQEELGVKPGQQTIMLYEQIKADQFSLDVQQADDALTLSAVLKRLQYLQGTLLRAQHQVTEEIDTLRTVLRRR
jgi:DNA-binding SARP family transcriptional activator